jgi:anti-sigma factor (TIGR02949 family)
MNEPVLRCEEALRHLAAYLDHELAEPESEAVGRHLETCRHCYSRSEFEKRLKAQIAMLRRSQPDASLEERVRRILRQFRPASGTSP